MTCLGTQPLERAGMSGPNQQIGTDRQGDLTRQRLCQKSGLIEPALQHPQPMQGHRRNKHVAGQKRLCGPRHPERRRAHHIVAIAMFQREYKFAAVFAVNKRRSPA